MCAGVIVRIVSRDDWLDRAIILLLAVTQDHMLMIVHPPEATPQQALALALLQACHYTTFTTANQCCWHLSDCYAAANIKGSSNRVMSRCKEVRDLHVTV